MNLRHLFLGSLGLITLISACGKAPAGAPIGAVGDSAPPVSIQAVDVSASTQGGSLEIPATIESSRQAVVASRLSATVVEMNTREGERVNAGAILARLDAGALQSSLTAAQASDAAATRDLARAEALLAKGAATRNEVENATTAVARTRAQVSAAREAASHATVRAPFAGRITKKIASLGDTVGPGTPIVEMEGDGGLEVVASVESDLHGRLTVGQKLDVRIDGIMEPVAATIRTLAPSADPSTHRFSLRADLPTQAGVRAGLFGRIALPFKGTAQRIMVPAGAVLHRGGLTGVYVIRDGRAWLRWIALGDSMGEAFEVRSGLEDKERVALNPTSLHDGARVTEAGQ